jgi:cytochrome b pre-mRNA-processing protein 3
MGFFSFIFGARYERVGFLLYNRAVQTARDPAWFETLGVPDTLDGRFDVVGLFAALLIRRLRILPPPGAALAQAVFDAMFSDMDFNLRELGVSDMSIGRRMRAMLEAFHGRALAYDGPLDERETPALAAALARNVWRGNAPPGAADRLARAAQLQDKHLASIPLASFQAGVVAFLPARSVLE